MARALLKALPREWTVSSTLVRTLFALALMGCVVSPQPEPPGATTMSLDDSGLRGAPGTVPGGEGIVVATALFGEMPPSVAVVNPDGSFGPVPLEAPAGQTRTRVEVRVGEGRSPVVDVDFELGLPVPVEQPLDCVVLEPELDLGEVPIGVRTRAEVVVANNCLDAIEVNADFTFLRFGARGFVTDLALPQAVPPGSEARLLVDLTPAAPGLADDILSVDLRQGPTQDRRFVTLVGVAR